VEIYILRHGIAETAKPGQPDEDRALTGEGRKKLRAVLKVAARAGLKPALILTSPYRRAVQTAEIAAETLNYQNEVAPAQALEPGGQPEDVWTEIRAHPECRQILLATHEPLAGYLAAYLVGGPAGMIDVKKASLIRIDVESTGPRPKGILRWILTPGLALAAAET
jgi:phosphohistidine phosphatase